METVYRAFEHTAKNHGARFFLPGVSYRDALGGIQSIAARYAAHGYGAGHRVALLFPSGKDFLLHFLALNSLGASVVPLNPEYRDAEREYILQHSEAALVVTPEFHLEKAGRPTGSGECALLYTSGTTGKPKGCLLSNFYFLEAGRRYLDEGGLCTVREGEERLITPLPLFHMNALAVSTTAMILAAGCVVQLERFHPKSWWRDVADSGATIVHYLGVMPAMLLNLPESAHERAHRVRFGFGANANPKDHAAFEARFGFPLIEAWAMTETGGGAMVVASREPRHVGTRCFGRPRAGLEVRLAENSELLVRQSGPDPRRGFFSGYYKDDEATEQAWRGGWFHTGDAVRQGPDGQLHFIDRLKSIIRRSGENIAALEVEATLAAHPGVRQVAVVAAPDPVRDEEVLACVILHPGISPDRETAASMQKHCLERLSYFKAPGYVAFVEELPVTSTNKVQKARLADFASNPMASKQCFDLREAKKRR
ncbi:MAG TPA: AMP-binding protein [Burkholderiales bacterium]